nr:formate/nitrite transporter family protein [Candidatus Sigynarchaeum springense]MDO8117905.1 formate/nitrite transporter family protein [Candidatus Sigynarchaeota archaeon]
MSLNTPPDIAKALEGVGTVKCGLSFYKMFMLAILAGIYIGFGAILATTVGMGWPATGDWATSGVKNFLMGSVFSVGLILVVLAGAELFTGNNLISIALCSKKVKLGHVLKSWIVVWIGNFAGSLLLAAIFFGTGLWKDSSNALTALGKNAIAIANIKANLTFSDVLFRGILCNILVCLAVWISISSKEAVGKILAIYFPIMAFVAMGFEHSIANMYFIPIGLFINTAIPYSAPLTAAGWGGAMNNIIAATIGNMIGGVILVGIMYWSIYLRQGRNAAACAPAATPATETKK